MKLQNHPRTAGVLCAAAVLLFAAMPAVFLAVTDAAYFGNLETVTDPYTAPTPTADDYYILSRLAARGQTTRTDTPQEETPQGPKMYIGAAESLSTMRYADGTTADAAETALTALAEAGAVPELWAAQALEGPEQYTFYTDYDGNEYDLGSAYCTVDSLGFVTVRRFSKQNDTLFTRYSVTMDSRTGAVIEVWLSLPAEDVDRAQLPDETALRAFAAQAGLESLGDWAVPTDSPYGCALASENGNALITASTHPYTYGSYTVEDSDRWYYSLSLQKM